MTDATPHPAATVPASASDGPRLSVLSDELLERIAERIKALADPTRLKILHQLQEGEICVGDLADRVGGSQANVSKHLAVLRKAGLVTCRRDGMNVCYRVADESAFTICRLVCDALVRQTERTAETLKGARR